MNSDKPFQHTPGSLKRSVRQLKRRVAKKERTLLKMRTLALEWKFQCERSDLLSNAIAVFDPSNPTRDDYLIKRIPKE